MRFRMLLVLVVLLWPPIAFAQSLTIGNNYVEGPYVSPAGVRGTVVDFTHPATSDGTIDIVGFAFDTPGWLCPDAVKIKFFRPEGNNLTMIAERGPVAFDHDIAVEPVSSFRLNPPVPVLKGDVIGIVSLTSCGQIVVMSGPGDYETYAGDVTGTISRDIAPWTGKLAVWGTGIAAGERTVRILPVVGSMWGAMGSRWTTSLQLLNPHAVAAKGSLVLRSMGGPASSDDPALHYELAPGAAQSFDDVITAIMGHPSNGIGSIDIVIDSNSEAGQPPVAVARVFSDRGDGGTLGFTDVAFDPSDVVYRCSTATGMMIGTRVLQAGVTGFLLLPDSVSDTRFNIGVRSLSSGATIKVTLVSAAGAELATNTHTYLPDSFEQADASHFLGTTWSGGESVRITVIEGSAIVYGSPIDNVTNDSSLQYVYSVSQQTP